MSLDGAYDDANIFAYTKREPHGVCALITAWNSPMSLLANKLAPWDECLEPGEVVLGGSFTRPTPAAAGDTFHADYGPLGSISFRFI